MSRFLITFHVKITNTYSLCSLFHVRLQYFSCFILFYSHLKRLDRRMVLIGPSRHDQVRYPTKRAEYGCGQFLDCIIISLRRIRRTLWLNVGKYSIFKARIEKYIRTPRPGPPTTFWPRYDSQGWRYDLIWKFSKQGTLFVVEKKFGASF